MLKVSLSESLYIFSREDAQKFGGKKPLKAAAASRQLAKLGCVKPIRDGTEAVIIIG